MTTSLRRFQRRQPAGPPLLDLSLQDRFSPGQRRALATVESLAQTTGLVAAALRFGLPEMTSLVAAELGATVVACLAILCATLVLRDRASLARESFRRRHLFRFLLLAVWMAISLAIFVFGPELLGFPEGSTRLSAWFGWSDLVILVRAVAAAIGLTRGATAAGTFSPALLLAGSFIALITVGTLLLLLPRCRALNAPEQPWPERIRIAAFTATSAGCVTGLIVVPTGGPDAYWSRTGQTVILGLFQLGGLGIMTFGAFFALATGRSLRLRESVTLRELFNPDQPINVRRLLIAILAFTFGSELLGALLISGLWADLPPSERTFYSLFHSVSAFCNAGFDITGQSLYGWGGRWQVWGVVTALIILGGLGFGVHYNLAHTLATRLWRREGRPTNVPEPFGRQVAAGSPARLTVTTRLVLATTILLLAAGTAWHYTFEAMEGGVLAGESARLRLADSWFLSVTYRTAGFSTVDHAQLRPASMLFAIVLMFIGASPISCGGGVKTAAVAIAWLALVALLKGRPRAEAFGRTIPDEIVKRALTIIALGGATLITTTLLLAAFDGERLPILSLMYEAASACGTVGVSTGITANLSPASQCVIMAAMFLGRVGPLTLLLGLAGQRHSLEYEYPDERVTLG